PLLTGLRVLQLELAHFAADDEIAVVEAERAGNAVFVHLEADRINRRALAALLRTVEIADPHRPSPHAGKRRVRGRRVGGLFLVGRTPGADDGADGHSS